jgi:hypothetical protein
MKLSLGDLDSGIVSAFDRRLSSPFDPAFVLRPVRPGGRAGPVIAGATILLTAIVMGTVLILARLIAWLVTAILKCGRQL